VWKLSFIGSGSWTGCATTECDRSTSHWSCSHWCNWGLNSILQMFNLLWSDVLHDWWPKFLHFFFSFEP
jgi:hypothetical protein